MTISIAGLDKATLLATLHNHAKPVGMGHLLPNSNTQMTRADAARILDNDSATYFDYVNGRPLKVDLGGDSIDPWLYDRDNGDGARQAAVDAVRAASAKAA